MCPGAFSAWGTIFSLKIEFKRKRWEEKGCDFGHIYWGNP